VAEGAKGFKIEKGQRLELVCTEKQELTFLVSAN
jgi:hypothetical protein